LLSAAPARKALHLSQTAPHPFALTNLVTPALDAIVRAISDRGNQTEAQRLAKANQALTLILSYLPCDVIDMTLAGQAVMFNELLADGARDVLRGMADTAKQRSFSGLIGMGRLVQGHLDRLEKRGCKPYRTEVAAPHAEKPVTAEAEPPPRQKAAASTPLPLPATAPQAAATTPDTIPPAPESAKPAAATPQPLSATVPQAKPTTTPPTAPEPAKPAAAVSWLDEPYEQWLVETPADLAWRVDQREAESTVPRGRSNAAGAAHAVAAEGYVQSRRAQAFPIPTARPHLRPPVAPAQNPG
jgi:hypothetical protein